MAANPTDEMLARLRTDWPQWQVWTVLRAVGGTWVVRAALGRHRSGPER